MSPKLFCLLLFTFGANASTLLDVKFHKQERELSCEIAALRMVLNFHNVEVTEADVLAKMPFDNTKRKGNVWGDPHKGFVGNIDGKMAETGYGIYWGAISKLASHWKKADVLENGTIKDIVTHLDEGRPVIIWGVDGPGRELSWVTPEGKKILALSSEHTFVVSGYEGSKTEPTAFRLLDPMHGPKSLKTELFLKNWDSFGRKAVVVYR